MKAKDITGQVFGRLTVIGDAGRTKDGRLIVRARCIGGPDCVEGNEIAVIKWNLLSGQTRSCGCLAKDSSRKNGGVNSKREATPEALRYQYVELKQSIAQLAKIYGASIMSVSRWLKNSGVETRSPKDGRNLYISQNRESFSDACSRNTKLAIEEGRIDIVRHLELGRAWQAAKGFPGAIKSGRIRSQRATVWIKCLNCAGMFSRIKSRPAKFCSHDCHNDYRRAGHMPNMPAFLVAGLKNSPTLRAAGVEAVVRVRTIPTSPENPLTTSASRDKSYVLMPRPLRPGDVGGVVGAEHNR